MLQLVAAKPRYLGWLYKQASSGDWIAFIGEEDKPRFKCSNKDLDKTIAEAEAFLGRRMKLQETMNVHLGYRIY